MSIAADSTAYLHASQAAVAAEWARAQAACAMLRAAMTSADVVYHRSWPMPQAAALLAEADHEPLAAGDGWLDSTLDLRDGLSVVEVFAPMDERAALQALAALSRR